jgi:hypothetical protein
MSAIRCHAAASKCRKVFRFGGHVIERKCIGEEVRIKAPRRGFYSYGEQMTWFDNPSLLLTNSLYNDTITDVEDMSLLPITNVSQANRVFNHKYAGVVPKKDIPRVIYNSRGISSLPVNTNDLFKLSPLQIYKEINIIEQNNEDAMIPPLFVDIYEEYILGSIDECPIEIVNKITMDPKYNNNSPEILTALLMLCKRAIEVISNDGKYPIGKISVVNSQHSPSIKLMIEVIEYWSSTKCIKLDPTHLTPPGQGHIDNVSYENIGLEPEPEPEPYIKCASI